MLHRVAAVLAVLVAFAAGTAVAASPAAAAAPSCPTGQACVVVTWHGEAIASGAKVITGTQLASNPSQGPTTYPYCSVSNCSPEGTIDGPPGTPIRDLINELGAGFLPESVRTLTITRPGQTKHPMLDGNDLRAFTDPLYTFPPEVNLDENLYPYVYTNGNGGDQITYLRPKRNAADENALEEIDGLYHDEIDIDIDVAGAVLHPTIEATSPTSISTGGSVSFRASVPSGSPTYAWFVGDTQIGTGDRLTHRFDTGGKFDVYVKATAPNATGRSDPIKITVGSAAPPPKAPPSNPGRGTGTSAPADGPTAGTGLHAGAPPSSALPGPVGASQAGAPSDAAGASTGARPSATSTRTSAPDDGGLVAIRGILLNPAAGQALPAAQRKAGRPETAPASRAGTVRARNVVFGVGLAAAVLALLVLGAVGEARRPARVAKRRAGS